MQKKHPNHHLYILLFVLISAAHVAQAQTAADPMFANFERRVTEYTLPNGLKCLFIKRDAAPVVSFATFVNAGSAQDPMGMGGMAHIFEHMAFKGTHTVGTTNWVAEKETIQAMDDAYVAWLQAKTSAKPDEAKLKDLWDKFQTAQEQTKQYVKGNEFALLVDREGGQDLNAYTANDETAYTYSLPANKVELWFNLEADRFTNPVMREFYVEKEVIREERRMRVESNPTGRLIEEFTQVALSGHPYGRRGIGLHSDITNTTMAAAKQFYETYYVPNNIVVAIAGDIDPEQMKKFADEYLAKIPAGKPVVDLPVELVPQRGERRFAIEEKTQPFYVEGYRSVNGLHPDAEALSILSDVLSGGRTSRLYKRLVTDEAKALQVGAFNGFPGTKYPALFLSFVVPNRGISMDDVEKTVLEEIEKIKKEGITDEELKRAVTNARANLIRSLNDNSSLALALASAQTKDGDWREVFRDLEKLKNLKPEDIKRVANTYLVRDQRTVGMIKTTAQ